MAVKGQGTKFKKGDIEIGELTSIGGLDLSADTVETTTLSDLWRKYEQGLKDAGEVSLSGYFDPSHEDVFIDFKTGDQAKYTIEFPAKLGAKWEFDAIVIGISTSVEMEDNISFEATLKVSGEPTLVVTQV